MALPSPVLKTSWPEVVGMTATPAVFHIKTDRPDVAVEVLPQGAPLTPGYNDKRVRVFLDDRGIITQTPVIG
ncbi:hypothetical protein ACQ4PT_053604 [Festuca glaucescens]